MTSTYDPSLYGQRAAAVYDGDTPACDDRMIDVLAGLAGRGRALELGIGTGRVALPLAARGVPVEGIDISPAMVDRLRAKPGGADIPVTLGSFADMPVAGRFELVYVVFNTFYMLRTQDEQERCVAGVAQRLRPGGSFVVEGFLVEPPTAEDARHEVARHVTLHHSGVGDRGPRQYPVELRVASPPELDRMARRAGLRLSARWADWGAEPFGDLARSHVSIYTR